MRPFEAGLNGLHTQSDSHLVTMGNCNSAQSFAQLRLFVRTRQANSPARIRGQRLQQGAIKGVTATLRSIAHTVEGLITLPGFELRPKCWTPIQLPGCFSWVNIQRSS
ncbi:hypothetical protein, partial [Pseudomonas sp. AB6]|uniref:hypothetical protein n=1 Tax=Pseudomonas sp. AB6 TaxID=3048598 RepID=UPI002B232253